MTGPGAAVIELECDIARLLARQERPTFDRARRAAQDAAAACLAGLRDDKLGVAEARAARPGDGPAFAALRDELERGGELLLGENRREYRAMLREIALFGALAPSLLLYFLASILLFVIADRLITRAGAYRLVWHPPLVRLALFLCVFSLLVFTTRP